MGRLCITLCVALLGCLQLAAAKRALLVGIGKYDTPSTGWRPLHGDNDVRLIGDKLTAKGFEISTLTDSRATKDNIKKALAQLVVSTTDGDVVYVHFSGHGQPVRDLNGDEKTTFDQAFVCYDACNSFRKNQNGKPYVGQNHFVDDELFPYLNGLKKKVGKKGTVTVIFDSCYSGGSSRGGYGIQDPGSEVERTGVCRGTDKEFTVNNSTQAYLRTLPVPASYSSAGGRLTAISACGSDQTSYECKQRGSGRVYGSLSLCIATMLDMDIPMSDLGEYFESGKFRKLKVIPSSQDPVVEIYK